MTPFLTFSTIFLALFGAAFCLDPELAGLKQVRSQVTQVNLTKAIFLRFTSCGGTETGHRSIPTPLTRTGTTRGPEAWGS